MGHPFFESIASPSQKKWSHSPSGSFNNCHGKRTLVDSPEVEARSEHSFTQGDNNMPELIPDTGPSSKQQRQESSSPSFSPIRALTDPEDGSTAGSLRTTKDQTTLDSGSLRGYVVDSDLDTASGDCFSYSDTEEVSIQTAQKRYRKRLRASYKLSKGSDWMEAKQKRISECHEDIWSHDLAIIRSE